MLVYQLLFKFLKARFDKKRFKIISSFPICLIWFCLSEIMNCLMNELREYSHDYSKEIEDTPSHLLFQNLPRIFCVGDFTTFCDRLDTLEDVDRTFVYRSLCFKSLALCNAGKFSKGLTSLAVAAEYWLANLSVENRSVHAEYLTRIGHFPTRL